MSSFSNMQNFFLRAALLLAALFLFTSLGHAQDLDAGKSLFKSQCASCHNKNMKDDLTGPALGGVEERWADYPAEDLYTWIRNSQAMIADGHPRAVELWNEWKPTVMNAFPNLTDEDMVNLLAYIDGVYQGTYPPKAQVAGAEEVAGADQAVNYNWFYWLLLAVLALFALILTRVVVNLNKIARLKEGLEIQERSLVQLLSSKGVIAFVLFAAVVLGGYTTVNNAINMGRQQNYAPEQPIKFSHATHAGLHQIDCQYCHDGARRSKHSVIPATNTCMNCHRAIKKGSQYGTAELTKIFASIGYDPANDKYIEDYSTWEEDKIESLYKDWIAENYVKDNELVAIDAEGKAEVQKQWNSLKESLTNETKPQIQGPIEWVRIHNLPDHVYFNHAQHVTVGQVECQQCHGKMEEMEVARQYSTLSMGWCINCHRQTEITANMVENDYYKAHYGDYIKALETKTTDKVYTVEDIGGLECQKCHY
jgi:mono/diheme cytochrome c family protein